jgi:hypothetical protein
MLSSIAKANDPVCDLPNAVSLKELFNGLGVESRHVMAWLANEQFRLLDADGFDCLEWGFEA